MKLVKRPYCDGCDTIFPPRAGLSCPNCGKRLVIVRLAPWPRARFRCETEQDVKDLITELKKAVKRADSRGFDQCIFREVNGEYPVNIEVAAGLKRRSTT